MFLAFREMRWPIYISGGETFPHLNNFFHTSPGLHTYDRQRCKIGVVIIQSSANYLIIILTHIDRTYLTEVVAMEMDK